ncbi:hypothetical protein NN561_009712 [Cricetulus griseus]
MGSAEAHLLEEACPGKFPRHGNESHVQAELRREARVGGWEGWGAGLPEVEKYTCFKHYRALLLLRRRKRCKIPTGRRCGPPVTGYLLRGHTRLLGRDGGGARARWLTAAREEERAAAREAAHRLFGPGRRQRCWAGTGSGLAARLQGLCGALRGCEALGPAERPMTELRQRSFREDAPPEDKELDSEAKIDGETASDSESRADPVPPPTSVDDTPEVLNRALSNLSSRFIVPISCVICNDIMAYMFGFFFGRTPLIKLSPKKTWEGFIGGFFATVVFGLLLSYVMSGYRCFVCPVEYNNDTNSFTVDCEPSDLFRLQEYNIPGVIQSVVGWKTVRMYPFQIHSIALSTFASLIGPFGGFFASGFKRAFKIKDFANTIPGHGGIMDRFDCQYLMATFVNVYIASFIRGPNPSKLIQQFLTLRPDQQLHIFNTLKSHLTDKGILTSALEDE